MSRLVHDCQGGGIHVILMQSHWLFGRLCRILYHLILWCIYVCFYIKCLHRLESDVKKERRKDEYVLQKHRVFQYHQLTHWYFSCTRLKNMMIQVWLKMYISTNWRCWWGDCRCNWGLVPEHVIDFDLGVRRQEVSYIVRIFGTICAGCARVPHIACQKKSYVRKNKIQYLT